MATRRMTPHRTSGNRREKGQVVKSQDLGSAALLLAGLTTMLYLGEGVCNFLGVYTVRQISGEAWLAADTGFIVHQYHWLIEGLTQTLLPILAALMLVAIAISVGQVGFLFTPSRVALDWQRINPLKGFGRIFALQGAMRLGFGIFKVIVVAAVAYASLYQKRAEILALAGLSVARIGVYLVDILLWTGIKIAAALLTLAIFDYAFQKWKHEQDLRMTTQEFKDEMKTLQGDPMVAARRRALQRQLAMSRLGEAMPKADFVVTNPTELAIAIEYKPESMQTPVVVAKGAGVLAQRIRRTALESGVPIVERKELARALYQQAEINQPIPFDLFSSVAEVVRYVYELQNKTLPGTGKP